MDARFIATVACNPSFPVSRIPRAEAAGAPVEDPTYAFLEARIQHHDIEKIREVGGCSVQGRKAIGRALP